jgi:hypothetical protein
MYLDGLYHRLTRRPAGSRPVQREVRDETLFDADEHISETPDLVEFTHQRRTSEKE